VNDNSDNNLGAAAAQQPAPNSSDAMELYNRATQDNQMYFTDQMGTAYVRYNGDHGLKNSPVKSMEFKDYLRRKWRAANNRIIGKEALNQVLAELEAEARAGNEHELKPRVAYSEEIDSIVYDYLDGTGEVAVISKQGVNESHIDSLYQVPLLRTESHQKPQDRAVRSSDPTLIKDFIDGFMNIQDHSKALVCAWIGASLMPHITQPAIYLTGEPASGKSTQLKVLRELIDPSVLNLMDPPNRKQDAELQAAQHSVLMYDNMADGIPRWLSDHWCRVITGGTSSKRAHNENTEMVMINFKAPIAFNGINLAAAKADLLDRTIILHTLHIDKSNTRDENADFYPAFKKMKPVFLGAIFNVISEAMKIYPTIEVEDKGRFGDFVKWGAAICAAAGYGADRFINEYKLNRDAQVNAAIEGDILATQILAWLNYRQDGFAFEGTTTELLHTLNVFVDGQDNGIHTRDGVPTDKYWPSSPKQLTNRLNMLQGMLEEAGVHAVNRKKSSGSFWELFLINGKQANDPPQVAQPPLNSGSYGGYGDG